MMRQLDLQINRDMRRILVKHWIDLGRLSVRTSGGNVFVRGSLCRIGGVNEDLTSQIVQGLITEIKRIRHVKRVNVNLSNWCLEAGTWVPRSGRWPRLSPARDQPISVPFRLTGPQWTNMPKRIPRHRWIDSAGAANSFRSVCVWASASVPLVAASTAIREIIKSFMVLFLATVRSVRR